MPNEKYAGDFFQSNDHYGASTSSVSSKRYCLQCGAELLINAVPRDPAFPHGDWVSACSKCGSRNYGTPIESQGINMILAGRVAALEKEMEDKRKYVDKLYSALICIRSALEEGACDASKDYARMLVNSLI